jgi:tRNA dimethylallyltransferase
MPVVSKKNKKAIFLMGPTASGKTSLVIELAARFPIDIISVDSAMIYKDMNIGTGKPSLVELQIAPHALINILDPSQIYSAADFCKDALHQMQKSHANKRIPVLVGGTMLYFKALQSGLSDLPAQDPTIRSNILQEAEQHGWQYLHTKLVKLDKKTAKRIHCNDQQRIQRALEIIYLTGNSMSEALNKNTSLIADWDIKLFALAPETRAEY